MSFEPELLDSIATEERAEDDGLFAALDAGLEEMEESERELVEMSYFEAMPHDAIAARLAITPKAVEGRLARARAKLRGLVMKALKSYALF